MSDVMIYLLKVNVILAICYGVYRLCSQGSTFFHLHRYMLLGVYVLAAVLPFAHWDLGLKQETVQEMASSYVTHLNPSEWPIVGTQQLPTWGLWILGVYGVGVLALYSRFLFQLGSLLYMGYTSDVASVHGRIVHILPENKSPFSFFNWIFIDPAMHTEEELRTIMMHEEAHVSQKHSLDIIWAEVVSIFFWFNPFMWLMKREIRTNLEFLADNQVCKQTPSIKQYQYHLLGLACGGRHTMLANKLNMAPLKKRVLMMNKQKSVGSRGWRYLLFVPVVVVLGLVSHLDVMGRTAEFLQDTKKNNTRMNFVLVGNNTNAEVVVKKNGYGFTTSTTEKAKVNRIKVKGLASQESTKVPQGLLVIIDGKEYKGDLDLVAPNDILSMDVIKGEGATKKYGKKAKNGVLIITMKH